MIAFEGTWAEVNFLGQDNGGEVQVLLNGTEVVGQLNTTDLGSTGGQCPNEWAIATGDLPYGQHTITARKSAKDGYMYMRSFE